MLILHYTGMDSAAEALDRLCDPSSEVSAHYLIEESGAVWRLVPETERAWHAGRSFWAGATDINSRSIGIELANPGHGPHYRPFAGPQMAALEQLAREILARHPIPPGRVLAHSDVAPARKCDPGELLDWRRLAAAGIGLWSDADAGNGRADGPALMRRFGYEDAAPAAIRAFQRHYRPHAITGTADAETLSRLEDLVVRAELP
jgi:N-acetylmuramoyl-L-alanine amidase